MSDSSTTTTWLFPTTRNNAVGLMSSGVLLPARCLDKYYEDAQALSPGRLLLISGEDGVEVPGLGTFEDEPAVLTLEVATPLGGDEETNGSIRAPAIATPASLVTGIHLRDDKMCSEFVARTYDNFQPDPALVDARPDLIDALSSPIDDALRDWLRGLPDPESTTSEKWAEASALGGAALMTLGSPCVDESELRMRARILQHLLDAPRTQGVSDRLADALERGGWLGEDEEADSDLLGATLAVLTKLSPAAKIGARRVAKDVRSTAGDNEEVSKNLDRVDSVLRAESELRPLTSTSGLRSAKALLLFLLRNTPADVITWSSEMTGDPPSVLGAALLCGTTRGVAAVPADLRSPVGERITGALMADYFNAEHSGSPTFLGDVDIAVSDEGAPPTMSIDSVPVLTVQPVAPASETPSFDRILGYLKGADTGDTDLGRLAAAVCLRFGWTDLATTTIQMESLEFSVRDGELNLPGVPVVRRSVDYESLASRLAEGPAEVTSEIQALIDFIERADQE